jgi:arylsulfatase A
MGPFPSRPNVIVFLTDDQGYGDLGVFGNEQLQTPHIDRLAHEGVRLTQHYSGSPICAPARASFLTGRYNHRSGALSVESNRGLDRIALRERTNADYFKAAGYATGMIGKWHNGLHDLRYHPNNRGFDEFFGFLNGGMWYFDWIIEVNGRPRRSDGSGMNPSSSTCPTTPRTARWKRPRRRSVPTSRWTGLPGRSAPPTP